MADKVIKSPSGLGIVGFSSLVLSHLGKLISYDNSFQCLAFRFSSNSHIYTIYCQELYLFKRK